MSYLEEYLATRRDGWPYDGRYRTESFGDNGFVARIDDNVAGLAWAEVAEDGARMHMNLKSGYAEYGIGTELLHMLMGHLKDAGCSVIRYEIPKEFWAYQIYENLGLGIEKMDEESVAFVWKSEDFR